MNRIGVLGVVFMVSLGIAGAGQADPGDRIGKNFATELRAKEQATGLKLLVPGVSWGDKRYRKTGLDPLPASLTPEQAKAIQEVVDAHDPTTPGPATPQETAQAYCLQAQLTAETKGLCKVLLPLLIK